MSLLLVSPVAAQTPTDTPQPFETAAPAPTATLPASGSGFVRFDFTTSPAGFDLLSSIGGTHSPSLGFQSVDGELGVTGGFAMAGIYKVEYFYTSDEDYSLTLNICDPPDALCGDIVLAVGDTADECPTVCSVVFDVEPIFGAKLGFIAASGTVPAASLFILLAVEVSYDAVASPEYELDGDCPLLSPAQYALLEPSYASACSRCFSTPTPFKEAVPTTVLTAPAIGITPIEVSVITTSGVVTVTSPAATATPGFFETQVDSFSVSSASASYQGGTYLTDATLFYRVQVSGAVQQNLPITAIWVDPQYGTLNNWSTFARSNNAQFFVPLGDRPDAMVTTYNGAHTYNFLREGTGGAVRLRVFDTEYIDNAGSWSVTVWERVTDAPTATPTGGAEWFGQPTIEAVDCSVAEWRDDTPVARFDTEMQVVGYDCYLVVPEVSITLFEPDLVIDGVSVCVTWVSLPIMEFLGITITWDWVMIGVIAYIIRLLVAF